MNLKVNIGNVEMENPVMTASGTFGYGSEFSPYFDISCLGGVIVKGLSLKERLGNDSPRIIETASGMINAIGLQNVGVKEFIYEKMPDLRKKKAKVWANIFGETIEEYGEIAKILSDTEDIVGLEINISCPNVKKGGIGFGTNPIDAAKVVEVVKKNSTIPVMTKLSPNVTDIKEMVIAVQEAGTDSISLINTVTAMSIDVEKRIPMIKNVIGGLSGPAIKPIAVRMVWEASLVAKVPLIGVGGIMNARDALEFIIAGASAIQIGTANFVDPRTPEKVLEGIKEYMTRHNISDVNELIGSLKV